MHSRSLSPLECIQAGDNASGRDDGVYNSSVRLLFDIEDYHTWVHAHQFTTTVEVENRPPQLVDRQNFDLVMRGGRLNDPAERWGDATGVATGEPCCG